MQTSNRISDAAAQADSARWYMDMRKEPEIVVGFDVGVSDVTVRTISGLCDNCDAWSLHLTPDTAFPVETNTAGWVCERCRELCAECGNHPPTEGHMAKC